ncbi:cysteine hydrolase [Paenibacillus athensensis]|nr:isochorismatase family cysteine hydrolase [Paenibacillus athensensis]MCD1261499.1 cysteine hydrolase [Paenibacillus athensensis]
MQALIVIDYTFDFVLGALPVGEPAVAIGPRLCEITRSFLQLGHWVVMAVDVHDAGDPYHPETKLFPPHNLRGTDGRRLFGELESVYEQNRERIHWMDKTRYSSFAGTDLDQQLRARGIQEVHLAGVCTDICVLHTAVDAYNRGYRVFIHSDAVASFDPKGHEWALGHFEKVLGAMVVHK